MHLHVEPPSGRAVNGAVELVAERELIAAESTESVSAREGGESIRQALRSFVYGPPRSTFLTGGITPCGRSRSSGAGASR
jgi:hypothetical protein